MERPTKTNYTPSPSGNLSTTHSKTADATVKKVNGAAKRQFEGVSATASITTTRQKQERRISKRPVENTHNDNSRPENGSRPKTTAGEHKPSSSQAVQRGKGRSRKTSGKCRGSKGKAAPPRSARRRRGESEKVTRHSQGHTEKAPQRRARRKNKGSTTQTEYRNTTKSLEQRSTKRRDPQLSARLSQQLTQTIQRLNGGKNRQAFRTVRQTLEKLVKKIDQLTPTDQLDARYNLAYMLLTGKGGPKDLYSRETTIPRKREGPKKREGKRR